ncbi:reverse transcriptase, partial [Globisporangium splendens]
MLALFGEQEIHDVATGQLNEDASWDVDRKRRFVQCQAKVYRLILGSLSEALASRYFNHTNGSEVWEDLVTHYEGAADTKRVALEARRISNQLRSSKGKHGDMVAHLAAMFQLKERLEVLQRGIADYDFEYMLLDSVPNMSEYNAMKQTVKYGDKKSSPEYVRDMILLAEAEMQTKEAEAKQMHQVSQHGGTHQHKKGKVSTNVEKGAHSRTQKAKGNCCNCDQPGHVAKNCSLPTKKEIASANCVTRSTKHKHDEGECKPPAASPVVSSLVSKMLEPHPDAAKMAGFEEAADCAPEISSSCCAEDDLWIVYPGSNVHIAGNKQYFVHYRAFGAEGDASGKIEFVNSTTAKPVGIGTIALVTHCEQNENMFPVFTVDNVLYLPNATNLFSPGLGLQQGFEYDYDRTRRMKKIYKGESVIIEAKFDEDFQSWPFRAFNSFLSSTKKDGHKEHFVNYTRAYGAADLQTWHFRLAHCMRALLTNSPSNTAHTLVPEEAISRLGGRKKT